MVVFNLLFRLSISSATSCSRTRKPQTPCYVRTHIDRRCRAFPACISIRMDDNACLGCLRAPLGCFRYWYNVCSALFSFSARRFYIWVLNGHSVYSYPRAHKPFLWRILFAPRLEIWSRRVFCFLHYHYSILRFCCSATERRLNIDKNRNKI